MAPQLDPEKELLGRARQKINAAKVRSKKTWEQLFAACDADGSGTLNLAELRETLRGPLNLPASALCDYDVNAVFQILDNDNSGDVELVELVDFLTRGQRSKEEEEAKKEQQVKRVRKALELAFSKISSNEAEIRQLFQRIDLDGEGKVSFFEFEMFVRRDLELNFWHVKPRELRAFYDELDTDGDGLEIEEFLAYMAAKPKVGFNPASFQTSERKVEKKECKLTFRRQLLYDCQSSYRLGRSASEPLPKMDDWGVNLGRTKAPVVRGQLASKDGGVPSLPAIGPPRLAKPDRGNGDCDRVNGIMHRLRSAGVQIDLPSIKNLPR